MIRKLSLAIALFKDFRAYLNLTLYVAPESDKVLFVNVKNPQLYHRFFYLALKFYQLSGYTIYYPMDFMEFRNFRNKDRYLGLIVREKHFLTINKKNLSQNFIEINDSMFSADYFLNYFDKKNQETNAFHIPMSFHPFMYNQNIWNLEIDTNKKRVNSIFCYGNFDAKAYLAIENTSFKVVNRTMLLSFFKEKKQFISVHNKDEAISAKQHEESGKFVFAIKENYAIKMEDVRELLSYYNFYLCCPGVVMPLCHNVIEAMSVGTIPLIQREYAEVMYPNLKDNFNAIIFEDLNDLDRILSKKIFNLNEKEVSAMRRNVFKYYDQFLSPKSVVKNINKSIKKNKLIYLQAEHRSVKFIKS